jgi:plasmid stability protein
MKNKPASLTEEQILLNMPRKLKKRIEEYAATRGMNMSVAIRMILDEKLKEEEVERKRLAG